MTKVKSQSVPEIRITLASFRYARLQMISKLTGQPAVELVKLAIDDYYNRLLLSGVILPFSSDENISS